jgi:hypothetical protein
MGWVCGEFQAVVLYARTVISSRRNTKINADQKTFIAAFSFHIGE